MGTLVRIAAAALFLITTSGCGAPYLLRAAYEEARILWRRQPITDLLARDDVEPETREKLRLVLAVRSFARDTLGFKVGNSYATLSRVDADAVAYVVTAAHRDRLEPYTWRYPIVGRVPYRGFFEEGRAQAYATTLEAKGLDAAVWPSVAFSTLGWFADPLLSNMLDEHPVNLVTVVFHELVHAQVFVRGAAEFNESLANFAGHRAAIVFFCDPARVVGQVETGKRQPPVGGLPDDQVPGRPADGARAHVGSPGHGSLAEDRAADWCALARARWHDEGHYAAVLATAAGALDDLYAAAPERSVRSARRLAILAAATEAISSRPLLTGRYRGTEFTRFNNAVLVQQLLYRRRLPLFEEIWAAEGEDLRATIDVIKDAVQRDGEPFAAAAAAHRHRPVAPPS
jgi:hypothetical protein